MQARPAAALILVAALAPAMPALEALPEEDAVVAVRGFELRSLGRLETGPWRIDLHPKGLLGASWESNPLWEASGNEHPDSGLRGVAGLEARTWIGDRMLVNAEATIDAVRYQHSPGLSFVGGEIGGNARWLGDSWKVDASTRWKRDDEPQSPLPDQVERETLDASVATVVESRSWRSDVRLALSRLDYLEDGPYFTADEKDSDRATLSAGHYLLGGHGSSLGMSGDLAAIRRERDGDVDQATVLGRWQHPLGERAVLDLRLGGSLRQHAGPTGGLASNDDRQVRAVVGRAGILWSWETGSWLVGRVERNLLDGTAGRANASTQDALVSDARIRLLDRLGLRLSVWGSQREDSAAADGAAPLRVRSLMLRGGPEYQLREGLGIRAWGMFQHSTPSVGYETRAWSLAVELGFAL